MELNTSELGGLKEAVRALSAAGTLAVSFHDASRSVGRSTIRLPDQPAVWVRPRGARRPREIPLTEIAEVMWDGARRKIDGRDGLIRYAAMRYGLGMSKVRVKNWLDLAYMVFKEDGR